MGYYTDYSLSFLNGSEDEQELIRNEISEKSGCDFVCYDYANEVKWYTWEKDLIEISKNHPDVIIELEGSGEGYFDIWAARFLNGKEEYHSAEIPAFTEIVVNH